MLSPLVRQAWHRHWKALSAIALQGMVLSLIFWRAGDFSPKLIGDSDNFIERSRAVFSDATLSSIQTIGYPLFLKVASLNNTSLALVPLLQFWCFVAAVALFYLGLTAVSLPSASAAFLASCLFYGSFPILVLLSKLLGIWIVGFGYLYFSTIMSDWLALCSLIATMGGLLQAVKRSSPSSWTWLSLATFVTYLIRPTYLYLMIAVPVLWLLLSKTFGIPEPVKRARRQAPGIVLAMLLPFLGYSTFRYLRVGHFGLVSAGGANFIGLVAPILSPAIVPRLSPELRDLASQIMKERDESGIPDIRGQTHSGVTFSGDSFSTLASRIAHPLALRVFHGDAVAANNALSKLCLSLVKADPGNYLKLVFRNALKAIGIVEHELPFQEFFWMTLLVVGAALLRMAWRSGGPSALFVIKEDVVRLSSMLQISVGILLGQLGMLLLVAPPWPRYVTPAAAFLPLFWGAALWTALRLGLERR